MNRPRSKLKSNNSKIKFFPLFFLSVTFLFLYGYHSLFYTSPLLRSNPDHLLDRIVSILYFGWYYNKALILEGLGRNETSQKAYGHAAWYRSDLAQKLLNLEKVNLLSLGRRYEDLELHEEAALLYHKLVDDGLRDLETLREISDFFIYVESWEGVFKVNQILEKMTPQDPYPPYYIGLVLLNQKRWDDAEEFFRRSISLKPDFADAYYRIGLIYEEKKDLKKAMELYEKTVNLLPNHLDGLLALKRLSEGK